MFVYICYLDGIAPHQRSLMDKLCFERTVSTLQEGDVRWRVPRCILPQEQSILTGSADTVVTKDSLQSREVVLEYYLDVS